jgi:hypothetical protein
VRFGGLRDGRTGSADAGEDIRIQGVECGNFGGWEGGVEIPLRVQLISMGYK